MANPQEGPGPARGRWRPRLNLSLRVWMILVAVVGVTIGLQYRRESLRPGNVRGLSPVARLPKADIWKIAWSRDRDRMAVIGWEKPVEVRDPVSLGLLETIGEGKKILHFAFSPKAEVVAYSENDGSGTAYILDRKSGKEINVDAGSIQPDVAFSPDGTLLATGGVAVVRLWSVGDGHLVREFVTASEGGLTVRFSPDGKILAVGNRNDSTILFETSTGRRLSVLGGRSTQEIQFDPGGRPWPRRGWTGASRCIGSRTGHCSPSVGPRPRSFTRWTGPRMGSSWRRRAARGRSPCGTPAISA